jgi:dTDP-glucose pyrophosphorylase
MSSYLGVLFCGGRGTRLGTITEYVSKALVPVYDRPAFLHGLEQLRESRKIADIIILSNQQNDAALRRAGHPTVIQDDSSVGDMFSGLDFVREATGDDRPAVLMPCDNVSAIRVDDTIEEFETTGADLTINLRHIENEEILRQIGVFDPDTGKMEYRPRKPRSHFGVLAPYVVRTGVGLSGGDAAIINNHWVSWRIYDGFWFDIGTPDELAAATDYLHRHSR